METSVSSTVGKRAPGVVCKGRKRKKKKSCQVTPDQSPATSFRNAEPRTIVLAAFRTDIMIEAKEKRSSQGSYVLNGTGPCRRALWRRQQTRAEKKSWEMTCIALSVTQQTLPRRRSAPVHISVTDPCRRCSCWVEVSTFEMLGSRLTREFPLDKAALRF